MSSHAMVTVRTDAGDMPAHLWTPDGGGGAGVVLLQEIFGISRYIQTRGEALADEGYVVLAPELYWRVESSPIDESAEGAMDEAFRRMNALDWPTTVQDSVHALQELRRRDEVHGGTGVLGFCFGGGLAFNVAADEDPDVLVSYYGSALPNLLELADQVTAPSIYHFGLADDYIPARVVGQIEEAVATDHPDTEFHTYPKANHAFDNWNFALHDNDASALAWERTLTFLHRELPTR
ncbi:MAG: dienelactone hydrolase family protein [Nocardioidaceae bacterium]|nr:dienelactone hydrolase family protein [Nocardioidaceae bacterium]NUS52311.1 dienelactone hydrolase family protein [Nocardioidaceae bacterium]